MNKKCLKCSEIKPQEDFNKDRRTPDGFGNVCKICNNIHRRLSWSNEVHSEKVQALLELDPNYFTNTIKICTRCNKAAPLVDFPNDKRCWDTKMTICRDCLKQRNQQCVGYNSYKKKNRELYAQSEEYRNTQKAKSAKYRKDNNEKVLLSQIRNRVIRQGLDFDLSLEDIKIPVVCPILNIPLKRGVNGRSANSPSVDRVDNSKGYTKDNIRIISNLANTMKNNATSEQLKTFSENIVNYINGMI